MTYFVRRDFGWMSLPENVGAWLSECNEIADMCKTGVITFREESGLKILGENFTYAVEFHPDETLKIMMAWFESGDDGEIYMTMDGNAPPHDGVWTPAVTDLTDAA